MKEDVMNNKEEEISEQKNMDSDDKKMPTPTAGPKGDYHHGHDGGGPSGKGSTRTVDTGVGTGRPTTSQYRHPRQHQNKKAPEKDLKKKKQQQLKQQIQQPRGKDDGGKGDSTVSSTMVATRPTTSVGVPIAAATPDGGSSHGGDSEGEIPGAYAMGGPMSLEDNEATSAASMIGSVEEGPLSGSSGGDVEFGRGGTGGGGGRTMSSGGGGEDLVAIPVTEDDDHHIIGGDTSIQHARPSFPQGSNQNNSTQEVGRTKGLPWWSRRNGWHGQVFIVFVCAFVLALAVFVGTYVGISKAQKGGGDDEYDESNNKPTTTGSSTSSTTGTTTSVPTTEDNPGISITTTTSAAPIEDILMGQLLPSQMQMIMDDPDSPQSLAYEWLLNDPNLDTYPLWRRVQRYAMATLFLATDGPNSWKRNDHWMEYDHHECTWAQVGGWNSKVFDDIDGFVSGFIENLLDFYKTGRLETGIFAGGDDEDHEDYCDDDGKILLLRLGNNGLMGILPPQIGLLTSLEQFILYQNELLVGQIPTELGLLTNLNIVQVSSINGITGPVPSQIGLLTNIGSFSLAYMSGLTGTIPSEIGLMTNAFAIHLPRMRIGGPLPSEIGELQNLRLLHTQGSFSTGAAPVPTEFFGLSKLRYLNAAGSFFQSSSLSSPPSSQIYKMSNLEFLDLSSNGMTGWLPTQLSLLTNLRFLNLGNNNMSGALPTQVGLLSNTLEFLQLHSNDFSDQVPAQLGLLTNLLDLTLFDNPLLSGTIPDQACVMTVLSQRLSGGIFFNCSTTTDLCGCGQCNCSNHQ